MFCEHCGTGEECIVCGRGLSHLPLCWEVYHDRKCLTLFKTKSRTVARVFCFVFRNFRYAPEGWCVF